MVLTATYRMMTMSIHLQSPDFEVHVQRIHRHGKLQQKDRRQEGQKLQQKISLLKCQKFQQKICRQKCQKLQQRIVRHEREEMEIIGVK